MSEILQPCPFCGGEAFYIKIMGNYEKPHEIFCSKCDGAITEGRSEKQVVTNWNTRPIEDDLRNRIAELEALVDELKPYRDGYDPEEVFPPEGEWVWLRDCDDNVEVMGYSQKEKCYWNYEGTRMPDDGDIVRWYPIGKLPEVQE